MEFNTIDGISWGSVDLDNEVRDWIEGLSVAEFGHVAFYIDLLAERGGLLSEPYTKQFDGKLRQLRFYLGRTSMRLTYWIAPGRRIIFLTVFAKTRGKGSAQVARTVAAMRRCNEGNHIVEEE